MPTPEDIKRLEAGLDKLRSELSDTRHKLYEHISKLQNENFKLFMLLMLSANTALIIAIMTVIFRK